ncbi:nuclear receptor coactivator 3 isoform X2 [Anastrepha ludens]|uniref:nuclear receptor coactivator 3 isoform X2 n=1 Tax=Anastrepha ludens TaxID=28586 RepID=UPI0023B03D45|nr:nuclear receptor coactivator 3 isoform X2 [Anastrepha ludens]XP_053960235.1 nuclear receptor coactivator 3 isoform X2 [Anastrepha ludens]XP_053960236.1 nuclear receptor coactivator 3 isoform X2 [Anastrepha ludens]XP_053960237.1 nuclear receptor coactivator 3 isoform X2 [Anastrepha ludens]XP_053960238.1 nuclear receptor coactivator 3 isoform X2 [Anastrepha ludens]XP_053960239.1 nuclear receptor coactivator 3 isoform X2 [Anastrepha ludens]
MSIAAAENAGLGPCEISDPWEPNTTTNNNSSINIIASSKGNQLLLSTTSSTTTASINIDSNIYSNSVLFNNNSTATTANSSTITVVCSARTTTTTTVTGSLIYKLPLSSPAAATAAVTASTAGSGSGSVVTAPLVGLAPSIPNGASLISTGTGGVGGVAGLLLSATASTGAGSGSITAQTTTAKLHQPKANNDNSTADGGNQTLTLQQQEQQQLQQHNHLLLHNKNNLNISLNNNNNLLLNNHSKISNSINYNLILRQKAVAAANLAAALQNSITMNAVASPISNNPATPTRKIRRKTDPKANLPQSQINKCNNEKRRRELENNYIEQLSEFLQLNKRGDVASTKPDKAAILNQVVKTYREFCDKGQSRDISSSTSANSSSATNATSPNNNNNNTNSTSTLKNSNNKNNTTSTRCPRCATDNCSIHPVQQGDVSSTEPPLPEPSLLNGQVPEISAYFEALEHYLSSVDWVLLQVTADGIIESCTQNIRELIGYDKQELYRKPLYQYLYPGDHAKLDPLINNMSYGGAGNGGGSTSGGVGGIGCGSGNQTGWADQDDANSGASSQHSTTSLGPSGPKGKRNIAAKVRMLVKDMRSATQTTATVSMTHPNDAIDQKTIRQHVQAEKYEEIMLLATPMKDDGDSTSSILCLITRPEDEPTMQQMQPQPIEHLTFKLDVHGKILNLDTTALREPYRQHLSSWLGRLLQDLCHPQDLCALKAHLREVQESAASVHLMNSPAAQSPGGTAATLINPPIANVMSRPFRLRLGAPDVYVHVKANSRLFLNQSQTEGDYIMSLQTILNSDNDMGGGSVSGSLSIGGSGSGGIMTSSGMPNMSPSPSLVSPLSLPLDALVNNNSSCSSSSASALGGAGSSAHLLGGLVGGGGMPQHTTQTTNVGGPLMTSAVINGTGNGSQRNNTVAATSASTSNNSTLVNSFTASPAGPEATIFYTADPFDFDLAHSSFEMDATGWTDSRPNSRASVTTPVSTPRPPSAGHGFSPAVCASPSTPYQLSSHSAASLPSPQSNASQPSSAGPFGFGFPAFDTSDKNSEKEHMNTSGNSNTSIGSNNPGQQGSTLSGGGNLPNGGPSLLTTVGVMGQPHVQPTLPQPESERLRHLLTNKSLSMPSSMHPADGDKDHLNMRQKFYNQDLLNSDDDKDGGGAGGSNRGSSGMFKMGAAGIMSARLFGGGAMPKSANSSNPMLLSLLNEKSEDDDGKGPSLGRQSELMRQLQKDDGHYGHSHSHGHGPHHSKDMSQEDLLKSLKYQGDPTTRKRSLHEPDDGISAKRENDRPSKLRENNKMLASLLENPPKNPIVTVPPQVKTIPDIAPTTSRVSSTLGSMGVSTPSSLGGMTSKSASMTTTSATSASNTAVGGGRGNNMRKQFSDAYLTLQQQQQQQHQQQCLSGMQRPPQQQPTQPSQSQMNFSSPDAFGTSSHNTIATSGTAVVTASIVTSQPNSQLAALSGVDGDSELSKILDSVMDYVSDDGPFVSTPTPTAMSGLTQQEINERMAINAIQNSLMVETSQLQQQHHPQQPQPPAYPGSMMSSGGGGSASGGLTQQQQQHQLQLQQLQLLQRQQAAIGGSQQPSQVQQMLEMLRANPNQVFQRPPPMYPAARNRGPMNAVTTPGGTVLPAHQQYRIRQQQQQQKERLLQQQQKQQLLVPESATARTDQLCLNPSINNIGSLLNNTVAPNVALSRTNLPPDSQLSPSFAQSLLQQQQQLSPGQRNAAFSPQANTGYGPQFTQSGQRLSPHQQHLSQQQQQQVNVQQQQQMAFQAAQAVGANVGAQLSPRQPPFGGGPGGGGVQSPGSMSNSSSQQWSAGGNGVGGPGAQLSSNATTQRGHSLQQHNPMLSAQLQGVSPYTARPYQNQRRSLNSPGGGTPGNAVGSAIGANVGLQRQASFQSGEGGSFSGTSSSPSPQSPYGGPSTNVFQQQQMQRMQRQSSVPQATQHLPGSPRPYGANLNHDNIASTSGNGAASSLGMNGGVSVGVSVGVGGFGGMMYNSMQHAANAAPPPQTPNDFYGRAQTAGNTANSSDFVKQELRAVVSVRAQQQAAAAGGSSASAGGNGVPGGGGGNGGGSNGGSVGPSGLRISGTPQSPLSNTQPGSMSGGSAGGLNSTNPLSMQQQQQSGPHGAGSGGGVGQNSLLSTPTDPTINFSFDTQDFFGNNTTR